MVNTEFSHLSVDGQKAFVDLLQAQQALAANQSDQGKTLIADAQMHLAKAAHDRHVFMKAEQDLPIAKGQTPPTSSAGAAPTAWIPVDGQYFVTETLTPDKTQAVSTANQHLRQGKPAQAAQDLQVTGIDADFIVGLAPLQPMTADIYRASMLLDGNNIAGATDALAAAVGTVRFVSDDVIATAAPMHKGHMMHHRSA